MDNRLLPLRISFHVPAMDGIQHGRSWSEVERNVIMQCAMRPAAHGKSRTAVLDGTVRDVCVADSLLPQRAAGLQSAFGKDEGQVVDVRDVTDRCRLRHRPYRVLV